MKRLMKKIGICLFTLAILLGTMPLTSVKATGQSTVTTDEAVDLIEKALDGKVSNEITEQEIEEIAKEALEGKTITYGGVKCELYGITIDSIQKATENSSGELEVKIYFRDTVTFSPNVIVSIVPIPQLPKEQGISINVENFPDSAFREYVKRTFDTTSNDVLSVDELAAAKIIDIGGNKQIKSVKGIEYFTYLEVLSCWGTSIESLDLTSNKRLTLINCADNQNLTSLNIIGLEELETLNLNVTGIKDLNLKSNKNLKVLSAWETEIDDLDVSGNLELESLICSATKIIQLDLTQNKALVRLKVSDTDINELDISVNLDLEWLICDNTHLNILDVSQHKNLNFLSCENSPLAYLNIGNNEKLTTLNKTDSTVNLDVVGSSFNIKEAFKGIDPNNMTMISGGDLDKETGIVSHYQMGTPIVYKYDCGTSGNGEETMQVTLHLNVKKGDSTITLNKELSKTYDGQPIELNETDLTVIGSSKPIIILYEEKREDSWVKLNSAPRELGMYRVKISVEEDEFYHSAEIVKEFEIAEQENEDVVQAAVDHEVPPTGDMNPIGFNIGILLISAGAMVYNMKRDNKKRKVK